MSGEPWRWCRVVTPLGPLTLAGDDGGLREIHFPGKDEGARSGRTSREDRDPFREAIAQLEAYFSGELERFDLALAPAGTPFQLAVWSKLREIPYGETTTYGELARRIGVPAASRAVGAANGRNPLPIVIPCHRVIGSDGSLTGYGGGLEIKRRLLALEARRRPGAGLSRAQSRFDFGEAGERSARGRDHEAGTR